MHERSDDIGLAHEPPTGRWHGLPLSLSGLPSALGTWRGGALHHRITALTAPARVMPTLAMRGVRRVLRSAT